MKKHVVTGIGEALFDLLPEGEKLGGAPANFAYHAAQLGMESHVVSAVGNDELGRELLAQIDRNNLNREIAVVPYPTGTVQISLDAQGVPCYDIKEGAAWDNIPFTPEVEQLARRCDAVCFGSLAQRSETSRTTITRFLEAMPEGDNVYKVFDINLRQHFYDRTTIIDSLRRCNILKINDEEIAIVSRLFGYSDHEDMKEHCRRLLTDYALRLVILTCGTKGSYVFTKTDASFFPTPNVKVADTVGAGDSFTGAFIASLLRGRDLREAHRLAVDVSAYVCTQQGAMPPLVASLTE